MRNETSSYDAGITTRLTVGPSDSLRHALFLSLISFIVS